MIRYAQVSAALTEARPVGSVHTLYRKLLWTLMEQLWTLVDTSKASAFRGAA